LISVFIILGILTAVVVSRLGLNVTDLPAIEASLKTHLRYAQSKAMQTLNPVWGIRIDTTTDSYWLFQCNMALSCAWTANQIRPPGTDQNLYANPFTGVFTNRQNVRIGPINIGNASPTSLTLVFDQMGVPYWQTGNQAITFSDPVSATPGLQVATDISIRLTDNSGNTRTVTLASETGFVQ
ncbi:MAG: hypothetical protein KJ668_08455, partial [Proteobacteria bacterium]|nr:hypothetical protein [Pseudomonadota bacterium]